MPTSGTPYGGFMILKCSQMRFGVVISALGVAEEERGCVQTPSSQNFLCSAGDKQQTRLLWL